MKNLVINLDRAPERMAQTAERFAAAVLPYERVQAVDLRQMTEAELKAASAPVRFYLSNFRRLRKGEIACALSHKKAWRQAFDCENPPAVATVFEDDAIFDGERLKALVAGAEAMNDPAVPTVWLLQTGLPKPRKPQAGKGMWYNLFDTRDVAHSFGAYCYALNAAAAKRLAAILTPMANISDGWSTFARCGVRVMIAADPCARTGEVDSTIPRKQNVLWSMGWFRRLYWWRFRLAFWFDILVLKRIYRPANP